MKPTIAFYLKNTPKKDGTYPIYIRVQVDRNQKRYKTNYSVLKKDWKSKKQQVANTHPDAGFINKMIHKEKQKIQDIIWRFEKNDWFLSLDNFHQYYTQMDSVDSLFDFAWLFLKEHSNVLEPSTIQTYEGFIRKLASYKEKLTLAEFNDYDFIKGFEGYLMYEKKNSRNTVNKSMDFWQTVIKEAKKKGLVQKNAFDDYTKLQAPPPKRVFLEKHELEKLWELRKSDKLKPYQAKVLDYFLFACYSGLRFSDIRKLKYKHFTTQEIPYYDTFREALVISIQPQKTRKSSGKSMELPVHDRAKEIAGTGSPEQHVFHTNVSQVNNKYLKEIAEIAGIEKKITFMVSRHTFATIMLNNGTPMEVVAEFLGHTDIKTTQIYAKIVDASKYKYMQQWNDSTE